jgi:hypothetical protein
VSASVYDTQLARWNKDTPELFEKAYRLQRPASGFRSILWITAMQQNFEATGHGVASEFKKEINWEVV